MYALYEIQNLTRYLNNLAEGLHDIFPRMTPLFRILDLGKAIAPDAKIKIIGLRAGEKFHEELITYSESYYTVDLKKYFAVLNLTQYSDDFSLLNTYLRYKKVKRVKEGFSYRSDLNNNFLTVKEIEKLMKVNMLT